MVGVAGEEIRLMLAHASRPGQSEVTLEAGRLHRYFDRNDASAPPLHEGD
ncbi:MAG: hypothetical protein HY749_15535 [Gammaproteobacteria bacterium]|nr:hypothetical protein [Gammaproteobacteria bacterium]MBI5617323.1 hypothetical protein [Gammaproteobacteria bacterium]